MGGVKRFTAVVAVVVLCVLCLFVTSCSAANTGVVVIDETTVTYNGQLYTLVGALSHKSDADPADHDVTNGDSGSTADHLPPGTPGFYLYIGISAALVLIGGLMSGLTVGLFSIDPLKLELMKVQGNDKVRQQAESLQPILSKHHFLLVTLLLTNAAAMEALPIFLDAMVPSYIAIIISVTLVLAFGEVIPQALCTKDPLSIGARFAWVVKLLMFVLFPIAWPIGKLLDWILGHGEARNILFKRSELKALVDIHASAEGQPFQLSADEAMILKGALDLKKKHVIDAMTDFENVFMLNFEDELTYVTMARILAAGFSRIPVYKDSKHNVVGLILVKRLIVIDPEENRPLKHLALRKPLFVGPEVPLFDMLNLFQEGKSHLAIVTNDALEYERCFEEKIPLPGNIEVLGIITIEDVVEEIIQEEIEDEDDVSLAHHATVERHVTDIVSQEVGVQRAVRKFKSMLEKHKRRQMNLSRDISSVGSLSYNSPKRIPKDFSNPKLAPQSMFDESSYLLESPDESMMA
jgi:metal transporter CNNM